MFTPFCKGLGIFCNGFWGCGTLGPHKCNRSDLSHSIKEVEIVEEKIPINRSWHLCLAFLSCISYRQAYWSRKRENKSALATLCTEALKRREEKRRERETAKKCAVGTLYPPLLNIIKTKFLWM